MNWQARLELGPARGVQEAPKLLLHCSSNWFLPCPNHDNVGRLTRLCRIAKLPVAFTVLSENAQLIVRAPLGLYVRIIIRQDRVFSPLERKLLSVNHNFGLIPVGVPESGNHSPRSRIAGVPQALHNRWLAAPAPDAITDDKTGSNRKSCAGKVFRRPESGGKPRLPRRPKIRIQILRTAYARNFAVAVDNALRARDFNDLINNSVAILNSRFRL